MRLPDTPRMLLRLVGFVLFGVTLIWGAAIYFSGVPASSNDSVTVIANQGRYALVLRTPPVPSEEQHDVLVAADSDQPDVLRLPAGAPPEHAEPVAAAQLGPQQWQSLDTLRANWCTGPPLYFSLQPDQPQYDVAVGCGLSVRRIKVPANDLPPELAQLLALVPVPIEP